MEPASLSDLVFLGVTRRANRIGFATNAISVTKMLVLPFFPQKPRNLQLLVAIPTEMLLQGSNFVFIVYDQDRPRHFATGTYTLNSMTLTSGGKVAYQTRVDTKETHGQQETLFQLYEPAVPLRTRPYQLMVIQVGGLMMSKPSTVNVAVSDGSSSVILGGFGVAFNQTPPIDEDERRAILSRPNATRGLCFAISAPDGSSSLKAFLNLDPADINPPKDHADAMHLSQIPDRWEAGSEVYELSYLKSGLHELFRHPKQSDDENVSLVRLYERGAIRKLVDEYLELIRSEPREEDVQKFLESV